MSFDDGARALYSTDASNYRQVPIGAVVPVDADDVVATIAICAQHGTPVPAPRGGTAMAAQSTNTAVVVDLSGTGATSPPDSVPVQVGSVDGQPRLYGGDPGQALPSPSR